MLNPSLDQVIGNVGKGLAVVAAAGSGKTTVLVERYLKILETGLKPDQILTVTFTREAAEQMRSRLIKRCKEDVELCKQIQSTLSLGTLHAFCMHTLFEFDLRHLHSRQVLNGIQWHDHFDRVFQIWFSRLEAAKLQQGLKLWNPLDLEEIAKEILLSPMSTSASDADTEAERWWARESSALRKLWDTEVLSQGFYSFNDLEKETASLLDSQGEAQKQIRQRYGAFLIDEFQDTSPLQWKILQAAIDGRWEKVFFVGDPRQSIYSFRHADVQIFGEACEKVLSEGGEKISLSTCYRSTPAVVEYINGLSQEFFTGSAFEPMTSARPLDSQTQSISYIQYGEEEKKSQELSQLEISQVTQYVSTLLKQGAEASEIALLFRHSDRIPDFAEALTKEQIAVRYKKSESFFGHSFSWDLFHFFKTLADPQDDFAIMAFLRSDFCQWTTEAVFGLSQKKGSDLFDKIKRENLLPWWTDLIDQQAQSPRLPNELLQSLFSHQGFWPRSYPGWESLLDMILEAASLNDLLYQLKLCQEHEVRCESTPTLSQAGKVSLLTIHAAKGLEFKEVILVDLLRKRVAHYPWMLMAEAGWGFRYRAEGEIARTPSYELLHKARSLKEEAEEKRLLYVALTRAKDRITVSLPKSTAFKQTDCWAKLFLKYQEQRNAGGITSGFFDKPVQPELF